MLKIYFEEISSNPKTELTLYNSITRIPFSLKIGNNPILSQLIYARNLRNGNFIEFSFDKTNKNLYEMSLISVENDTVENVEADEIIYQKHKFYNCFIHELDSVLEDSVHMKIFRYKTFIRLDWEMEKPRDIEYFSLSTNCLLGINSDSYLSSVVLKELSQEDIFNIFGF